MKCARNQNMPDECFAAHHLKRRGAKPHIIRALTNVFPMDEHVVSGKAERHVCSIEKPEDCPIDKFEPEAKA